MDVGAVTKEVVLALSTGVAASAAYEYLVARRKAKSLRDIFQPLEGVYREIRWQDGSPQEATGGVIQLTYCGSAKLATKATTKEGETLWHGELFMRQDAHVLGSGFYSYNNAHDVGFHEVIHARLLNLFT